MEGERVVLGERFIENAWDYWMGRDGWRREGGLKSHGKNTGDEQLGRGGWRRRGEIEIADRKRRGGWDGRKG